MRIFGIITLILTLFASTGECYPPPNHPMLFGYYYADGAYGDYSDEVKTYTNASFLISHDFLTAPVGQAQGRNELLKAFERAKANHQKVVYGISNYQDYPGCPSGVSATRYPWTCYAEQNASINALKARPDLWSLVSYIYIIDEPDASRGWTKASLENEIDIVLAKLDARGMPRKPFMAVFTFNGIFEQDVYEATNLKVVGIEAYLEPSQQNVSSIVSVMQNAISALKERVVDKKLAIVMQGYARNGDWTNIASLQEIQDSAYLLSFNDPRVVGIFPFSYGRSSGTADSCSQVSLIAPCYDITVLKPIHRAIGAAIMSIPTPGPSPSGTIIVKRVGDAFTVVSAPLTAVSVDNGPTFLPNPKFFHAIAAGLHTVNFTDSPGYDKFVRVCEIGPSAENDCGPAAFLPADCCDGTICTVDVNASINVANKVVVRYFLHSAVLQ